jgi:hypothetical protein
VPARRLFGRPSAPISRPPPGSDIDGDPEVFGVAGGRGAGRGPSAPRALPATGLGEAAFGTTRLFRGLWRGPGAPLRVRRSRAAGFVRRSHPGGFGERARLFKVGLLSGGCPPLPFPTPASTGCFSFFFFFFFFFWLSERGAVSVRPALPPPRPPECWFPALSVFCFCFFVLFCLGLSPAFACLGHPEAAHECWDTAGVRHPRSTLPPSPFFGLLRGGCLFPRRFFLLGCCFGFVSCFETQARFCLSRLGALPSRVAGSGRFRLPSRDRCGDVVLSPGRA